MGHVCEFEEYTSGIWDIFAAENEEEVAEGVAVGDDKEDLEEGTAGDGGESFNQD
jgi:hypothetical protein